jgi:hypothetical protein
LSVVKPSFSQTSAHKKNSTIEALQEGEKRNSFAGMRSSPKHGYLIGTDSSKRKSLINPLTSPPKHSDHHN